MPLPGYVKVLPHCCVCHGGVALGSDVPCSMKCGGSYCLKHAAAADPGLYVAVGTSKRLKARRGAVCEDDKDGDERD